MSLSKKWGVIRAPGSVAENRAKTGQTAPGSQETELGNRAPCNGRAEAGANRAQVLFRFPIYVPLARTLFD